MKKIYQITGIAVLLVVSVFCSVEPITRRKRVCKKVMYTQHFSPFPDNKEEQKLLVAENAESIKKGIKQDDPLDLFIHSYEQIMAPSQVEKASHKKDFSPPLNEDIAEIQTILEEMPAPGRTDEAPKQRKKEPKSYREYSPEDYFSEEYIKQPSMEFEEDDLEVDDSWQFDGEDEEELEEEGILF